MSNWKDDICAMLLGALGLVSLLLFSTWHLDARGAGVIFWGEGSTATNVVAHFDLTFSATNLSNLCTGSVNDVVFTITNNSPAAITGSTTVVNGNGFAILSGSNPVVAAGETSNVTVRLLPADGSAYSGEVVFATSNDGSKTGYVVATGVVPAFQCVLASTNLGLICSSSVNQVVITLTNTTVCAVDGGTVTVQNNLGMFDVLAGSNFVIAALATSNVTIQVTPNVNDATISGLVIFASANDGVSSNAVLATVPPNTVAGLSASPTSGIAPLSVTFSNQSTGNFAVGWPANTNFSLDFGDGDTFHTDNWVMVEHIYTNSLSTNAQLAVTGLCGVDTATVAMAVTSTNGIGGCEKNCYVATNFVSVLTNYNGQWEYRDSGPYGYEFSPGERKYIDVFTNALPGMYLCHHTNVTADVKWYMMVLPDLEINDFETSNTCPTVGWYYSGEGSGTAGTMSYCE